MSDVAEAFEDHRDEIGGPDRGWLRSAHMAREATSVRVNRARVVQSKGEQLVAECQAVVDGIDRETDHASQRASERVAAALAGDAPPPQQEEDHGTAARLQRRSEAAMRLATAQRAQGQLQNELATAEHELGTMTLEVENATADLLLKIGEQLAVEVIAAEEVARNLRHRLSGLSRLWLGSTIAGKPQALRMGPLALKTLNDLPRNDSNRQFAHDPSTAPLQRWQRTAAQLLLNSAAPLPDDDD